MTTPKLKPCPFCGWDAPYVRTTGVETEVYCESCTAVGPLVHSVGPDEDVDEVAIRLWNRRAKPLADQLFDQQIADYVKRGRP